MAFVRSTVPVVLTVGAGFVGYQYIYRSQHKERVHIHDGISAEQTWQV